MAGTDLTELQDEQHDDDDQELDYFDLLPDPIVLLILDKVIDSKSLSRSLLVSKRFAYLIPQVESISIRIGAPRRSSHKSKSNLLKLVICRFISKPLQLLLHRINKPFDHDHSNNTPSSNANCSLDVYQWISKYMKNFSEIRYVKLELPCHGGQFGADHIPLIKWTAEFDKTITNHSRTEHNKAKAAKHFTELKQQFMAGTDLTELQDEQHDDDDQELDYFDLLPDPIVLLILDKVIDSKSLSRSLLVSKRFAYLIPQVESISIRIGAPRRSSHKSKSNLLKLVICRFISKPLQLLLHRINKPFDHDHSNNTPSSNANCSLDVYQWISKYMKNFSEIRYVKLELPCHGGQFGADHIPLIKWTAEFGRELRRCAILGANSIERKKLKVSVDSPEGVSVAADDDDLHHGSSLSNDDLKCRILWIISCLLAASARHCLVKRMLMVCPKLKDATIGDASRQGRLTMKEEEVRELRDSIGSSGSVHVLWHRTCVPDVVIRLWYAKELELPTSGCVLRGATLMAVTPAERGDDVDSVLNECLGWGEEEAPEADRAMFGEAAREMVKMKRRQICNVEMNSF
ncbi:hypothetical protein Dimus_011770 [Dionaea muscipula]